MNDEIEKTARSWRIWNGASLKIQFQFEPRDVWVGVFWRSTPLCMHLYVCLLPLVPLHVTWTTRRRVERFMAYGDRRNRERAE